MKKPRIREFDAQCSRVKIVFVALGRKALLSNLPMYVFIVMIFFIHRKCF